jgi:hypothetical protein
MDEHFNFNFESNGRGFTQMEEKKSGFTQGGIFGYGWGQKMAF